ncbi:MAG: FAD-dependent oxidoreductase [Actinomycetota bacterium]|nr:FAD-dependent oxidoreductase [Actinomycetota bacterium]
MMRYVIIGNSYAGVAATEAIREVDGQGEITIISNEPYSTYARPLISYYLSGKVSEEKMFYRDSSFYQDNFVNLLLDQEVAEISPARKSVILSSGQEVLYDKLLISTGGKPFVPPMKGLEAKNIFTFTAWDDAKGLKELATKGRKAVVIGGGLIGLKASEGLNNSGADVTIVELGERLLALALDEAAGEMVSRRLAEAGIKAITSHTVTEILADEDGNVRGVLLDDGRKLDCEILVVAIGVRPNVEPFKESGIEIDRGIVVDEYMRTSLDDVYAAGDVVQAYDILNKRASVIAIVPLAYEQGRLAGLNMAGQKRPYQGGMIMNSVEVYGLPVMTMGLTLAGEGYEVAIHNESGLYRKLIFEGKRLVGAILVGDVSYGGVLTSFIRSQKEIDKIKSDLIEGDFLSHFAKIEAMERHVS